MVLDQVDIALDAGGAQAAHETDFRTELRRPGRELRLADLQRFEGLAVPKEHAWHDGQIRRRELRHLAESLHVGLPTEEIDRDRSPLRGT